MIWCNKFISAITSRLTKARAKRATDGPLSKEYQKEEEPIFYKTWAREYSLLHPWASSGFVFRAWAFQNLALSQLGFLKFGFETIGLLKFPKALCYGSVIGIYSLSL